MVTGDLVARSLIVVRCFRIAVARCMLSSPFSPVAFVHYRFVSFGVRCTLFAGHCAHFANDSMLRATSVLLFAFGYWLFASRCSIFVFRCLALVSRLLAAHYLQNPARPYSLLTGNCRFSLLALCRPLIAASLCGLIIPAGDVLFASQHVNILLTDARRSLQSTYYSYHSTLITSYTSFLVARRSLFEICCFLLADSFALLSSCSSLLFASHSVLGTRILLLADCCFLF